MGVVYRHLCQNITTFHEALEKTLESLKTDKEFYYVVSDININFLSSQNSIKRYTDMLYSQGCATIITHSTRISETSFTIIDHIYTNNISKTIKSFILIHDLTDHLPILVSTKLKFYEQDSATITFRDTI